MLVEQEGLASMLEHARLSKSRCFLDLEGTLAVYSLCDQDADTLPAELSALLISIDNLALICPDMHAAAHMCSLVRALAPREEACAELVNWNGKILLLHGPDLLFQQECPSSL